MKLLAPQIGMMRATVRTGTTATVRKRGRAAVADRAEVVRRDFGVCQACKVLGRITPGDEVDHTVPLEQGGSDSAANKRLLCSACHKAKTAIDRARYRGEQ